jgi:cold shock CspA family protein
MPLEQGIICSLKESFGFIHCAERPEEIFFHYSEVVRSHHPDDLQIDTEVEFRVGQSENDGSKRTAYAVSVLEPGTVIWETEEIPEKLYQGLVERDIRSDVRGGGSGGRDSRNQEGSIQVVSDGESDDAGGTKQQPVVRFRPEDIVPDKSSRNNNRLFRGDLVEFRVFVDRRTKQKYARHIVTIQTEKERSRAERERKMMESAVEEEGMVISLNNGYGFLKSNKRVEHVYFHFSQLIVPEDQDDFDLKKGQEMKFLVVQELLDGHSKSAARRLECLPKGSVQFHTVVAKGIKGTVTMCPRPPSAGNDRGYADDKNGSIRLLTPVIDKDSDGKEIEIANVSFEFNDAPGGVYTFQQRGAQTNGLWILEGDVLLFDLVKELADGSYQAAPTNHRLAIGGAIEEPQGDIDASESGACIRLAACSLVSRAEGTMHTIKEQGGYGFISFVERPVDAHFNTYNLMPEALASDLRKQLGYPGDEIKPKVGVGAHFDICAHGTVHSNGRGGGNRGRNNVHERENVKAHRILLLPSSAVPMTKTLAVGAKGVVKSADAKELYAGFVDIDDEIIPMTLEERHPLVAKMIDSFIEESSSSHGRKQLVYKDVLSPKDDEVVVELVKTKGQGVLTYDHIPMAGVDPRSGRLIIKRIEGSVTAVSAGEEASQTNTKKTRQEQARSSKVIRFDKASLTREFKEELPPCAGDVISCDVVQNRRTGKIAIENLVILERNELSAEAAARTAAEHSSSSGLGVIQNVVPKSGFGFISVLDENAARQELLFFSLGKDNKAKTTQFRKGDEVKFDTGIDPKTGKPMAINVEIVPIGTIPSKASKNACRGIILMEPTHTSLSDTPSRKTHSGESSGGRWANTKGDPHKAQADILENGYILLLEDKTGMFSKKQSKRSDSMERGNSTDESSIEGVITDNESVADDKSVDSIGSSDGSQTGALLSHLTYKNGAIAIHGTGAAGGMDSASNPKRGDIVTFVKARKGANVRDVRIEKRKAATFVRGRLENVKVKNTVGAKKNAGSATFIAATQNEEKYQINLSELVSCDASLLKDKQQVEGILHDGQLYGICRTCDLYLESKLGMTHAERPKLNLSVKADRGGRIIAQSHMAKGPDGTNGFPAGWTSRISQYI